MMSLEKEAMRLYEKVKGSSAAETNERAAKLQNDLEDWGNMEPIF